MRPLASIYSHRVPEFMETRVGFNPNQKRNSNPKRKLQPRLSVDWPVDRPMPRSTGPVDRAFPRANPLQSVDRGRSTALTCARPCTPVDRAGRPGRSTGLLHRSTGTSTGRTNRLLHAPFLVPLSSDLCAIFFHLLHLLYLLSPNIHANNRQ